MSLTIGLLSWGSHKTLENTLHSYSLYALDAMADQKLIWFQEISDEDRRIAAKYGWEAYGSPTNIGIAGGYKGLVELATGSIFLFLENDWVLIEEPYEQIITGAVLLEAGAVDVVRYRHRVLPGFPLWSKQFEGNEMSRPEYLLESLHWDSNPERHLDKMTGNPLVTKLPFGWYYTTAPYAAWTNNPTMFRTDFISATSKAPEFAGDVEISFGNWWRAFTYVKVAQGDGLFTHMRLD